MIRGHCFCKRIEFTLKEEPRDTSFCHCESCRRASGGAFVAWGTVDKVNLTFTRGSPKLIRTSGGVERGFCADCGTNLTYAHDQRAQEIDITLVTLQDPSAYSPEMHIWLQDKLPWVHIDDDLPQFTRLPGH